MLALQCKAGNAAVGALIAAKMKAPGGQTISDIDGAPREFHTGDPSVDRVETGIWGSTIDGVSVAGVLTTQRSAGNQATVALLHARSGAPVGSGPARPGRRGPVAESSVQRPAVQRGSGALSFVGDVVKGAGSYVADLGRGAKRTAKGLRPWNEDAMIKIAEENAAAGRAFKRLVGGGLSGAKTYLTEMIGVAFGGFVTWSSLPKSVRDQASAKFGDAAGSIVNRIVAKQVGKLIVQRLARRVAERVIRTTVYRQLAKKLGASAALSATGVGIPLGMLGVQGTIEKAAGAADRLKIKYPTVHNLLAAQDMHMVWFLLEPHVPEILAEIADATADTIRRTNSHGRVMVDSGGSNDRVPVATGGSGTRRPVASGGEP